MANNITNIISIVVNVAPAPPPPTSAPPNPPHLILPPEPLSPQVNSCYLVWRRATSKQGDPENTRSEGVIVGLQPETRVQPEETRQETPAPPKTPAPSTTPEKTRVDASKVASWTTVVRNTAHGMKEGLTVQPAVC
ncbi:hypothetical protein N7516_005609 [Penicillium verrucosum]|uniref:uncharacterized protein n=1 Tax=Penicillium verrucosum TaxID=60171 RepID=UPI002545360A|nr:uncharacterized protein N7516_005609 [Penicillium verrucosum]KAJ5945441.1 hypothetical protein N7516_005609 [Penicillium verrucosum]